MKHPAMLLIPVLMLMDYYLTIYGAILKDREYGDHYKIRHYELNPRLQKAVAQRKLFNPKHLILTLFFSVIFIWTMELPGMPDMVYESVAGCFFMLYGAMNAGHLANIMIFRYIANNPDEISGQIAMEHSLVLRISVYQRSVFFLLMVLIAFFSPSAFVFGGLYGMFQMILIHYVWIYKYRKKEKAKRKANEQNVENLEIDEVASGKGISEV